MNNQEVLGWLRGVVKIFDSGASVDYIEHTRPEFKIVTEDSRLIGSHGENLKALEYLVGQVSEYQQGSRPSLDINDYKKERQEKLMMMAEGAADQVVATGRDKVLSEMNSFERRIIHMVLADRTDVETESVGDGRLKRVKIIPKK